MKLTKSKLKQVIEEEIQNTLQEGPADWWSSQEHPKMHGEKKPPDLQQLKDNLHNALTALLDHVIAVGVGGGGLEGGETEPALAEKDMLNIVEELMNHDEYKEYLGLDSFNDYIHFPQKYACDDIDLVEEFVGKQLEESTSNIFLLGIGHSKSAILHRLKKYTDAVFMDVGAGIDNVAGCINVTRPYAGDWTNYRLKDYDYSNIDYLRYSGKGEHIIL